MIKYRKGYRYQLHEDYSVETDIIPVAAVNERFLKLSITGELTILAGYAWDGPSGPVIDTKENMRASLVHDAFYQLMRHGKIDREQYKDPADLLFKDICIEDGVKEAIAHVYYLGLKVGGAPNTEPAARKKIHTAP